MVKFCCKLCLTLPLLISTLYFHEGTGVSGSLLLFGHFLLLLNFPHPQASGRDCFSIASSCVFALDALVTSLTPQQPRYRQLQWGQHFTKSLTSRSHVGNMTTSVFFYQYVHHPSSKHVRTISVRRLCFYLHQTSNMCSPSHVLVLSIHTTPIRNLNTIVFVASCSASCLFLSPPGPNPCKMAGQTTIQYTFPFNPSFLIPFYHLTTPGTFLHLAVSLD